MLKSEPMEYDGHSYVSGWVDSANKFSTTFGRWEIRAKLPYGQGLWPAHVSCKGALSTGAALLARAHLLSSQWMMPDYDVCWPMGGEIDSMNPGLFLHGLSLWWFTAVCVPL